MILRLAVLRAVGLVAVSGGLAFAVLDWHGARQARGDARACARAAADAAAPLDRCADPVALSVAAARRAAACDAALAADDLFALRASCGEAVKRLEAGREAARAEAASLRLRLDEAHARAAAAIARAEARATAAATRTAHADDALARLRPDADGLLTCDSACLRQLAGQTAAAGP